MEPRASTEGTASIELRPECPDCSSENNELSHVEQRFQYGRGIEAVELSCRVPVHTCRECGAQWTGPDAERIRQNTIYQHLGRLTPEDVKSIRDRYDLSQAEASRVTGFGEASWSRWENGTQIQNTACDRLLRLIAADPRNLALLREMADGKRTSVRRFQLIELTEELRYKQRGFSLRRTG